MRGDFDNRVGAAAIAGGWTLLFILALNLVNYAAYMVVMSARPPWLLTICGPGLEWPDLQRIWFGAVLALKLFLLTSASVVLWLTLWSRQLSKLNGVNTRERV